MAIVKRVTKKSKQTAKKKKISDGHQFTQLQDATSTL